MKKLITLAVAVLAVSGGTMGLVLSNKAGVKQTQQLNQAQFQQEPSAEVSYKGKKGKNAIELLRLSHMVETKTYKGLGELVTTIDGTSSDSKHFWAFYVNGQQAQVGAGTYTTKDSDTIVWKLEEIK